MATYVQNTFTALASGAVNGARSFNTPAGAASGDRLIACVRVAKETAGSTDPSLSSIPSGWTNHSSQTVDDSGVATPDYMNSIVISGVHDGSSASYSVTIADAYQTSWGGNITCVAYSGNVDALEVTELTDAVFGTSQAGPSDVAAAGETCVAIMVGAAAVLTTTWDAPFTERTDNENYGLCTIADADGAATLSPTNTTSDVTTAIWTVVRLGVTAGRTYKRLYGPAQLPVSAATLYTVPTGMRARIRHIHLSNPTVSSKDVTISAGTDAASTRILDGYPLAADGIYSPRRASEYTLEAGETIQGFASAGASVVCIIDGYLESI